MIIKTKRANKKLIIIVAAVLVLVLAIGGFLLWKKSSQDKNTNDQGLNVDGINYGPATDEEKQETEQHKDDIANQPTKENEQPSNPSATPTAQATVVLTYANYNGQAVQAAGFVSGTLEEGGTCTLTLTNGGQKVTATSTGFADVNKTTCPPISIARSQLPQAGEWTAVLSYKSGSKSGSSAEQKVSVP